VRLIASIVVQLIANAVGLIVANLLLDDMDLEVDGFLIAVGIFTLVEVLIQPFLAKAALTKSSALVGGTALIASLIALIVTDVISDGLSISGTATWIAAAVVVWLAALLATFLLPFLIFKETLARRDGR
jgi:uncharacterized membrane protein YvlD (DUF360 family)